MAAIIKRNKQTKRDLGILNCLTFADSSGRHTMVIFLPAKTNPQLNMWERDKCALFQAICDLLEDISIEVPGMSTHLP